MKEKYIKPIIEEEKIEIEDVIAASGVTGNFGDSQPGDHESSFSWLGF